MLKEKFKRFVFNHPQLLGAAKRFLSNKYVANNFIYKYLVMRKAEKFARESARNNNCKHTIFIENVLSCNSRCIFCAHHYQTMTGTMSMELYRKIIDDCHASGIRDITFGVYGETLLDKYLAERIKYLRKYKMTYGFITNASLLTPARVEELFRLGGLAFVHFSVNGFSKEVYEKTMVGLKRDTAYKNILHFLKRKEELKMDNLLVNISTVLTRLNKKDLKDFFASKGMTVGETRSLIYKMLDNLDGYQDESKPLMQDRNNYKGEGLVLQVIKRR